jgi:hypothetical protein
MNAIQPMRSGARWLAAGVGFAAAVYATYVAVTWYRYGHVAWPVGFLEGIAKWSRARTTVLAPLAE